MDLLFYLPGAALGLGVWSGLRWPARAVMLGAVLACVIAVALAILAGMAEDTEQTASNQRALQWSVIPSLLAFLAGQGVGHLIARNGGGGME